MCREEYSGYDKGHYMEERAWKACNKQFVQEQSVRDMIMNSMCKRGVQRIIWEPVCAGKQYGI